MEITEFALNWLLYKLTKNPYTVGLYLSDRQNHVSVFSNLRLQSGAIAQSPILRKLANKCHRVSWQSFKNESHLYMYSAWDDFESARSIPADFAVIDEVQSTNVAAILHAKPTDNPSFVIVVTQSGVQVLVLVPHFSTHSITITNMSKMIPAIPEFPFTILALMIATFSIVLVPKIRHC